MKNKDRDNKQEIIKVKLSILIDIFMKITNYTYEKSYEIIVNTDVYNHLINLDYATLYDSPQANLSDIGKELRNNGIEIGNLITDKVIKELGAKYKWKPQTQT